MWRWKRSLNASDSTGLSTAGKRISPAAAWSSAPELTKTVFGVSTPARQAASIWARLSCTLLITSQRENGTMNHGSSRSAWRESGQMNSSWLGKTTARCGSCGPRVSSQVRKASSSASGLGQTRPAA